MSTLDPAAIVTSGLTDCGLVRSINQDACAEFFDESRGRRLLIVADGMGGHLGGEVASKLTVETVGEIFQAGGADAREMIVKALRTANGRVHERARNEPGLTGMGTTAVALLFEADGQGLVAHVGDSRAYRLRGGAFEQITEDHSVVGALIRMGHITAEEARLHPQRNEILRAIGTHEDVEVQVTPLAFEPGDRYLLCSDGLSGMVDDPEIASVLRRDEPRDATRKLVEMANDGGGTDNITVQIAVMPGAPTEPALSDADGESTHPMPTQRAASRRAPAPDDRGIPAWAWLAGAAVLVTLAFLLLRR